MVTNLILDDDLKMLRESLCFAASFAGLSGDARADEHVRRIGRIITEIDRKRPLGPDGKHGDRHTDYCGCEDVPRHFAPYGASSTTCGMDVPQSALWDSKIPDYASRLFTSRRSMTTCQKCVSKFV